MEVLLRAVAILIEGLILAAIVYCLLAGARLIIFDLGVEPKYKRVIAMALILVGGIVLLFFIAHLTLFYPAI